MIILNLKKINSKFKESILNYENITNFGSLECPHCQCNNVIRWGSYERCVIFFNDDNVLEAKVIKVQRIKCKGCGHTHALLPLGIVPYKQFSDEVISKVLIDRTFKPRDVVSDVYKIDISIIKSLENQFKKFHLPKLSTLTKCHEIKSMIRNFLDNNNNKQKYIKMYNMVFMQIKMGVLSLCPS